MPVNPDGSLFAPASSPYTYANAGSTEYPTAFGGDGINHFVGGGLNYDSVGSGFGFAGKMTTDTTDPAIIRDGAVVGTFSATPTRADWFFIGYGGSFTAPASGNLYLAVNDSYSPNDQGNYSISLTTPAPVPEASTVASFGLMLALGLGGVLVARKKGIKA